MALVSLPTTHHRYSFFLCILTRGLVCATERTLCCVLENFQTPEGFNVPEVLRKYIPGQPAFLPFVKEWKQPTDEKKIPERPKPT